MAYRLHWIINLFLVHTVKSPILGQCFIACASNIFRPRSPTHLSTHPFFAVSTLTLYFLFQFSNTFCFSWPMFSTQKMGPSACSFLCTIILINCSTFLCSGLPGRQLGRTDPLKLLYKRLKERKAVQVGAANGTHTPGWECRWADNACSKKLETMKPMDGRIRLDE